MRDCPHRNAKKPALTMFTDASIQKCYLEKLVGETFLSMLLDSGCTKTVCRKDWLEDYVKILPRINGEKIVTMESTENYRFGDSEVITSYKKVTIPVTIGKQEEFIETKLVDRDLPLLLSKESMKKASVIIDFVKDKATVKWRRDIVRDKLKWTLYNSIN